MSRVAILHYTAPPIIGGVESTMGDHARLLAAAGYQVRLVAGRGQSPDNDIEYRRVALADSRQPQVTVAQADLAAGRVTNRFRALAADLQRELQPALTGCDVILAHNVATLHKNLALTAALHDICQEKGISLVAWCHDFAWTDPLYRPAMHDGWPWDLLRRPWPGVRYVAVSQARRAELANLLGVPTDAIRVVPPGISLRLFLGLNPTAVQWMDGLALWDARPLLLLPVRVTRRKNIELAVRVTGALAALGLSPRLLVMGPPGPHNAANAAYLAELKDLCLSAAPANAVVFLHEHGRVSNAVRRDLYLLADLLLFTSFREGFGIPVLEAAATRLPAFCADIPPFRESGGDLLHYFGLGESPEAIAARIASFLQTDDAFRLRHRVMDGYRWLHILQTQIIPLIEEFAP